MANIVDRKWNSDRDIDAEDPLMQLSRIMSESAARENDKNYDALSEADIEPDFDFDDDFSSALGDAFEADNRAQYAAPPVELSLEDELAALLSDAPAAPAPPRHAAAAPVYQPQFDPAPVQQFHADAEIVDDQFEADPWQDIDLEKQLAAVAAEPQHSAPVVNETVDPVLAHLNYGRGNARYVAEAPSVSSNSVGQAEPFAGEEFEFELDPELAPSAPLAVEPDNTIEFARANLVPPAPEFDDYQPTAASAAEPDFDFTEDFDRLLAETAPEPVVEAAAVASDHVVATEEFDIPDFEFSDEPEIAVSTVHELEDDYRAYEAPAAKAYVASLAPTYAPQIQVQRPDVQSDADFETALNDELSADLDSTIGGYQDDDLPPAVSRTYAADTRYQANIAEEFEPFADNNSDYNAAATYDEPSKSRSWLAAALVAGIVVLGGAGYYAYSKTGASVAASGGPVLVKADPQPVKVAPENPGGKVVADQDKAVYDKVAGAGDAPANPGQLVTASEEPVDIAAVASDPVDEGDNAGTTDEPVTAKIETPAATATAPAETPAVAAKGKAEDRIDPALDPENVPVASADATAVAPKKVRTFVVKPDGSLVERPAAPAPVAQAVAVAEAPVAQAETPAPVVAVAKPVIKPAAKVAEPAAADSAQTAEAPDATNVAVTAAAPAETSAPAKAKVADAAKETPTIKVVKTKKIKAPKAEVETLNADAATGAAPIIDARPADQPVNIVGKTGGKKDVADTQVAAADATPQPTADQSPAATGAYVIQIASTPSAEAAKATYAALSRKFGNVIGGRGVNIQQAEVAGKGTVYRIRIIAGSKQDATALCSQYKSSGGSCFVSK